VRSASYERVLTVELEGKVGLVTGGGSGIGRATALLLARQQVKVVVAGRRRSALDEVVVAIQEFGGTAIAARGDLTCEDDARAIVRKAVERFGGLHLAVNAAGAAAVGTVVDMEETMFDAVIASNLKTTWLALKHEIPAIARAGGGAIVNVSSHAGLSGIPKGSAYSAAKHGVVGLTKSAALETGSLGIRINAVCPGTTRTMQFESIVAQAMPGASPDAVAAAFGSKVPLGRIADPAEIGRTIVWLLGPGASYITGAALTVDGGECAG
jgi:NAD(P)-dependent dehydrogenase (short-subunit alcohol dehydrogenase family)